MTFITPDPGCAYVLSVVRRSVLGDTEAFPDVLPLVEHSERFSGRSDGLAVRYHDPCYLGRRGRTFSAPRTILQAATGQVPAEFAQARDDADCSGGGGLYPTSNPDGAREIAARRLASPGHGEADVVVTACPSARRSFERTGHRVLDVVDVALGVTADGVPVGTGAKAGGSDG